jgi:16S rRNA processing protein RimM
LKGDLIQVGRVGRPHGLDGSFVVERASEDPDRFARGRVLRVGGEPAEIVASKRAGGRPVIKLDRKVERGAAIEVPRDELPPPGDDSYYVVDLVGLEVIEEGERPLGRVAGVNPGPANDVLELDTGALLPFAETCVLDVDPAAGRILVARGFVDPD